MKKCLVCDQGKPLNEFYKRSDSLDGYRNDCKNCRKQASLKNFYGNQEHKNVKNMEAYWKRKDKTPDLWAKVYAKRRDISLLQSKIYYVKNAEIIKSRQRLWSKTNRGVANALSKSYKTKKINATPNWLNESQLLAIKCKYQLAAMLNVHGVERWHVDHIVPLRGKTVSGLHVPWNLQVMPAKDNLAKGNRI
jgi:hypothetical protein